MANVDNQSLTRNSSENDVGAVVRKNIRHRFEQMLRGFEDGQLSLTWPDGLSCVYGQRSDTVEENADVVLHSYQPLRRLIIEGQIGFAESYMRGEWSTENLLNLFSLIMRNEQRIGPATRGGLIARGLNHWHHWTNRNSDKGSQRNIAFHYDLGNAFYKLWLDESMSYSSGIYQSDADSLEQAQQNKIDRIGEMLALSNGSRVLEVGCGWGKLAQSLASDFGADITGVSLSAEQLDYARENHLVEPSGAQGDTARTQFKYKDYRNVEGKFDHVVSIEMFEAVGEQYWDAYFNKLSDILNIGGTAVIQTITMREDRFDAYRIRPDFIQKYIFPGGMLPTKSKLLEQFARTGFELEEQSWFGASYAKTLRDWRLRFEQVSKEVRALDFDDRFVRMWRYYLVYCETGFSIGHTNVGLLKIRKV